MTTRRRLAGRGLIAISLLITACTAAEPDGRPGARGPDPVDAGLAEELEEQGEKVEKRLEALEAARAAGTVGRVERIRRTPTSGWAGERLLHPTGDDWEPAIATDPSDPYVYILHNRYGGDPACPRNCPDPAMIVHVSADGGATWGPERYLCACRRVQGQFDPLIEVVPETGAVYAVWMNDFDIQFSRSLDHGATWSPPVPVYGKVAWGDKPNLGVSDDGRHVYVLFNGPTIGDVHAAVSHDGGATWSQVRVTNSERYFFNYGVGVLPDGRVVSSQISFTYSGPGGAAVGQVWIHALASDDLGATWDDTIVDRLELGTPCVSDGCYADYYDSGPVLGRDPGGDLVIVYSGAAASGGPRTVYARSSTDGGRSWSPRAPISSPGANAAFAAATGEGDDEVHVWYGEQSNARWNVWYRTSTDLGTTWSSPVKISDATSGTVYKDANGFTEMYGDYGEIAVTDAGSTIGVWGAGTSYAGPGGVWYNREA